VVRVLIIPTKPYQSMKTLLIAGLLLLTSYGASAQYLNTNTFEFTFNADGYAQLWFNQESTTTIDIEKEVIDNEYYVFVNGNIYEVDKDYENLIGHYDRNSITFYEETYTLQKPLLVTGNNWHDYHKEMGKIYTSELLGLGLLNKADVQNENADWPAYKKYMMHGTSHHMGLDTHDYGILTDSFTEGMVFTNEPGFYIPAEGFGIRLEDDYVIQKTGLPLNLMANIPLEAEEIESLMHS